MLNVRSLIFGICGVMQAQPQHAPSSFRFMMSTQRGCPDRHAIFRTMSSLLPDV
jgi:hypothetical protein